MIPETQGKTINNMNKQAKTMQEFTKDKDWCSLQSQPQSCDTSHLPAQEHEASLSVLSYTPKQLRQQHVVNIDTKTLLKIEEVKLYLEGKGRSERTRDGFEKCMKQLAQRANLDVPQDVELAIARYKLVDKETFQPTNQPATATNKNYAQITITTVSSTKYHGNYRDTRQSQQAYSHQVRKNAYCS
jgi:hypothetical protein